MQRKRFTSIVGILTVAIFALASGALPQATPSKEAPKPTKPTKSPSAEILLAWNDIGGRLVDMAEDFPEDKYDFKATPAQRTFAENLLHVATDYYLEISAIKGSQVGPKIVPEGDLKRTDYPTKAAVVKLLKEAVTQGAALIQEQSDAGLTKECKSPYENILQHVSYVWAGAMEHAGEHYGQLVVYYRLSGMVPPASRPKK